MIYKDFLISRVRNMLLFFSCYIHIFIFFVFVAWGSSCLWLNNLGSADRFWKSWLGIFEKQKPRHKFEENQLCLNCHQLGRNCRKLSECWPEIQIIPCFRIFGKYIPYLGMENLMRQQQPQISKVGPSFLLNILSR